MSAARRRGARTMGNQVCAKQRERCMSALNGRLDNEREIVFRIANCDYCFAA